MVILLLRFMSIDAKTSTFEFIFETQREERQFIEVSKRMLNPQVGSIVLLVYMIGPP